MNKGRGAVFFRPAYVKTMKTLFGKRSKVHSHTWMDIGGFFGLFLDLAYFAVVIVVALVSIVCGAILLLVDVVWDKILNLVSHYPKSHTPHHGAV